MSVVVPSEVVKLVERFRSNREDYRKPAYKETRLRREFLDPFFTALGWDVDNHNGYAEAYKDVVHEDSIRVAGSTRAPDYSFRVGGVRKFFVEAKKPSVRLSDDREAAFQIRRYAWSAQLPLSILTDFDELAVYDTRIQPDPGDKAATARLQYFTSDEYVTRWDELATVFSREAVLQGAFDRYASASASHKGTAQVDDAFLGDIERWREHLAKNIAWRNRKLELSREELNYAVQATLDRIIFLRICEDRGLESPDELKRVASQPNIYQQLLTLFRAADERYNSGLFHFSAERGRDEEPDRLTPQLDIDDFVLKGVLEGLYYPKSPYEFSVIGADILGRVYEQFLGKTVTLHGSRVSVETKPEVKKAGGVYYTPTFVVDYIVQQTLAPLLAGKTPQQVSTIRVVDPACGSGSFLVAAYQHLLDWHLDHYRSYKRRPKQLHETQTGQLRLTTEERKRILTANIFGVDIDAQAVEVAKLSLLLKVVEGESQTQLSGIRLLPDLGDNVRCGNSLIASDYYHINHLPGLEEEDPVNCFDWRQGFPSVFADGGFDAVIGNPPYLSIDDTWGRKDPRLGYLKRAYSTIYNDKTDLLIYFLAKAVEISKAEVGFIVSRTFLEAYKADKLRGWLADNTDVREIIDFRNAAVFPKVGIATAIVRLTKTRMHAAAHMRRYQHKTLPPAMRADLISQAGGFSDVKTPQNTFGASAWVFQSRGQRQLNDRIDAAGEPLGKVLVVGQGMQTGRNKVFGGLDLETVKEWGLASGSYYRRVRNSDIRPYEFTGEGNYLLYAPAFERLNQMPDQAQSLLRDHRAELKRRAAHQRGNCEWWQWTWPLHKEYVDRDKIFCPGLAPTNRFALDVGCEVLGLTDTTVLYDNGQAEDMRYILGLLNSSLLTYRYSFIGKLRSSSILEYYWNQISQLPIHRLDPKDPRHHQVVELVQRLIDLAKSRHRSRTGAELERLDRQIQTARDLLDDVVFDLYGLSASDKTAVLSALTVTVEKRQEMLSDSDS